MRIVESGMLLSSNDNEITTRVVHPLAFDIIVDTYESYRRQIAHLEKMKYGKDIPSNVKDLDSRFEEISSHYSGPMEKRPGFENAIAMLVRTLALYKNSEAFDSCIQPCELKRLLEAVSDWIEKNFTEKELEIYFN